MADFPNNDELEKVEADLLNSDWKLETGSDGVETNAVKFSMSHLSNPILIFVVVTCAAGVFKLALKDIDYFRHFGRRSLPKYISCK